MARDPSNGAVLLDGITAARFNVESSCRIIYSSLTQFDNDDHNLHRAKTAARRLTAEQ